MVINIVIIFTTAVVLVVVWFIRHQRMLRTKAFLMREAVRNGDFTFRVQSKGMSFGEKALTDTLNDMENDIGRLTAQNEVESWEKLTRVLTHEINNATTPILSICQAFLASPEIHATPYHEGIAAIQDTTKALAAFVDSYRKMTQIQKPEPEEIALCHFMRGIACMYPSLTWSIDIPEDKTITIDSDLLRHTMINIIKNAVEAGAKSIGVRWRRNLYISNDGMAIPWENAREIFVPFYTTKRHGTGIGLSLSRQILMMQGYDISLAPVPQSGFHVSFIITGFEKHLL